MEHIPALQGQGAQPSPEQWLREQEKRILGQSSEAEQTQPIDWTSLEAEISEKLSIRHKLDLIHAAANLAGAFRTRRQMQRYEASEGKKVDRELDKIAGLAESLAKRLSEPPDYAVAHIDLAAGNRVLLGKRLRSLASSLAELRKPKRPRGKPRLEELDVFAGVIQEVWRSASDQPEKRGAHFNPVTGQVEGPVKLIAAALLDTVGLKGHLGKVEETARKSLRSRSQDAKSKQEIQERVRRNVDETLAPAEIGWSGLVCPTDDE